MLANRMVIAPRRRLEGRPPSVRMGDVVKDMDPITPEQIAGIQFDSLEQAVNSYKYIVRAVAVRTKVAYLSDILVQIQSDPQLLKAFTSTPVGQTQLANLIVARDTFLSLTQPNMFQNLQLIRNQMEVNVFPKVYNMGIEGRLPLFQSGQKDLSYTDILVQMPATFSFGDLSATGLIEDLEEMKALGNKVDPSLKLSGVPLIIILIFAGIWGSLALIWGIVHSAGAQARSIEELMKWAKENGIDPKKVQEIIDRILKSGDIWAGASNFLMWAAILLGTGAAGLVAWHVFA